MTFSRKSFNFLKLEEEPPQKGVSKVTKVYRANITFISLSYIFIISRTCPKKKLDHVDENWGEVKKN